MNIEKDIFNRAVVNLKKLHKYGFKKNEEKYIYEKEFLNNEFKAIIVIDNNGNVSGKVIDLQVNEEYAGIRVEMTGEFVNKVRESYIEILKDIRDNCFDIKYFIFNQTNRMNDFIKNKYKSNPEFLWKKFPYYAVYRNKKNKKWFGIIMNLDKSKLDNKSGEIEIINLKLNEEKVNCLLKKTGFYKAYHMNKNDWISVILDDTLKDEMIISLIEESYKIINDSKEKVLKGVN